MFENPLHDDGWGHNICYDKFDRDTEHDCGQEYKFPFTEDNFLNMKNMEKNNPKIAVVGAGYWGKNLVRNFHQLGVLKVICDADRKIQSQMRKDYPDVSCVDQFDNLLNDPSLAALVIATPAVTHFALASQALEAGKHVFVEKPLAVTYDEGRQLVAKARAAGKILFVGHILHYHQGVVKLKEMIADGKIGRLQYIYSRRLSFGKIRREEDILWSFAPHDTSLVLNIIG